MSSFLLNVTSALARWIGQRHIPYIRKKLKAEDYWAITRRVESGDCILGTSYGELSNVFIPGKLKHAALIMETKPHVTGIEAVGSGVRRFDLIDFVMSRDMVVIMRPKFEFSMDKLYIAAMRALGMPYDFEFESDNKAFYCSELVYHCYKLASDDFDMAFCDTKGRKNILPVDFYGMSMMFQPIYLSAEVKK